MTDSEPSSIGQLSVPVSPGELLDKISILKLKSERITNPDQLEYVNHELQLLNELWFATGVHHTSLASEVARLSEELQAVNAQLWEIEDKLREYEAGNNFGDNFIQLARSVYITNDRRAAIKHSINQILGSQLREEKSYTDYQASE